MQPLIGMITEKLTGLNTLKSPGPKGWLLLAQRKSAHQISFSLSILFNKSLQSGLLPTE